MFKTTAQRSALLIALIMLAPPVSRACAQTATTPIATVVTGGDPQPTGEPPPPPKPNATTTDLALAVLIALGLA